MGRADAAPTPRNLHEATVDHVAGRTFTVTGIDATFNRSTGRSKPVRRGTGAFGSVTYMAIAADSQRARGVVGATEQRDREAKASRAVNAWLADRTPANRRAIIDAMRALDEDSATWSPVTACPSAVPVLSNGTISVVEQRKIGRPSKGEREFVRARVPIPLRRAAEGRAKALGMTLNDYVGQLLAEDTGVPYSTQEGLKTA